MSEAQLEFLEAEIAERIGEFRSSRSFYRRGSLWLTRVNALLAALTTLLIGLNEIYHRSALAAAALAAAGATTVATAWGGWYSFRQLWVSYQGTLNELYALRSRISFERRAGETGGLADERVGRLYEEYQAILDRANAEWARTRGD